MQVLAHRGAWSEQFGADGLPLIENTIAAFVRARELGADGFECDVHRTSDDALVIHHDAIAEGIGVLAEYPIADIRRARPDIPTLDETLDACAGLRCNVEIKNLPLDADFDRSHRIVGLVLDVLAARSGDDVIVSSFNLDTMDTLVEQAPTVPTGWLIGPGMNPMDACAIAADHGHRALHPHVSSLTPDIVADVAAHAGQYGLEVNVWTVNEPAIAQVLADHGYRSIITDQVLRIRSAFG